MTPEQCCCAHRQIEYDPIHSEAPGPITGNPTGTITDRWTCRGCNTEFVPKPQSIAMPPEQRREQAEKEVREKLESIFNEHTMAWDCDFYPEVKVALQESCELGKISQTIALSEAQERIAELEKALSDIRWFADERRSLEHCVAIYNTARRALRGTHHESTKGE